MLQMRLAHLILFGNIVYSSQRGSPRRHFTSKILSGVVAPDASLRVDVSTISSMEIGWRLVKARILEKSSSYRPTSSQRKYNQITAMQQREGEGLETSLQLISATTRVGDTTSGISWLKNFQAGQGWQRIYAGMSRNDCLMRLFCNSGHTTETILERHYRCG